MRKQRVCRGEEVRLIKGRASQKTSGGEDGGAQTWCGTEEYRWVDLDTVCR